MQSTICLLHLSINKLNIMKKKFVVLLLVGVLFASDSFALGFPHRLFPAKVLKKAVSLVIPKVQK